MNQIWIGITVGVFFAGIAIGIAPGITENMTVEKNIASFDHLDFVSFNEQDWKTFNEIHSSDVLVVWPDGRETHGIDDHSIDVEFVFTYAPDVKIIDHPISFGQGQWTAGMGIVEGTFTEPMILSDGIVVEPTGNKFKYTMITIAKWQDGQIIEEYLYWDNAEVAKQMGLMTQKSEMSKNLQIEQLIETFKEKYSEQGITEYPDSKGIPYKYSSKTGVDLILEKDRVTLRAWSNDEPFCIVSNPIPRDILDNCPPKW